MKILVTGGAGFIGSNLVRLLLARGHRVLNVDKLTYAGNLSSLREIADDPGHRFLQADICDENAMRAAFAEFGPAAVMHLAAESHVDRSIDGPAAFVRTNVTGTCVLLEAARAYLADHADLRARFRFLHVSTDEVFGSLSADDPPFSETTPYAPHSPYSASKAGSDHLARAWHDTYGLPVLVTNCSNNYGPFQFPEKLIPVVILKALRGEPVPVYGDGSNIRDWLFVEDHAEALLRVLERGTPGETYNIGGNNEMRNIDLVRLLCRLVDEERDAAGLPAAPGTAPAESLITFVKDRPGHDQRYAMNASKIRRDLDWSPLQDRESGFRRTVQWYLHHRIWWEEILGGGYRLERLGAAPVTRAV